jgi:hypothetical protein
VDVQNTNIYLNHGTDLREKYSALVNLQANDNNTNVSEFRRTMSRCICNSDDSTLTKTPGSKKQLWILNAEMTAIVPYFLGT